MSGGNITLTPGSSCGSGGDIIIHGGTAVGSSARGGDITISTGGFTPRERLWLAVKEIEEENVDKSEQRNKRRHNHTFR